MVRRIGRFLWVFSMVIGPIGWAVIGIMLSSLWESYHYNVSFADALFTESWKKK